MDNDEVQEGSPDLEAEIRALRGENERLRREIEHSGRIRRALFGLVRRLFGGARLETSIRALLSRIERREGFPAEEVADTVVAILRKMMLAGLVGLVLGVLPTYLLWNQNQLIGEQTRRLEEQNILLSTQNSQLEKQNRDELEPRIVVSRLLPKEYVEVDGRTRLKLGTLSIKNVGKAEALDVRCTILNPYSGNHKYVSFGKTHHVGGLVGACAGESIVEALSSTRSPLYTSAMLAGEEREICLDEQLHIDFSIPEMFIAVSCAYRDKDERPLGGTIELALGSIHIPSSESDAPADDMLEALEREDSRVQNWRQIFGPPATRPKRTGGMMYFPGSAMIAGDPPVPAGGDVEPRATGGNPPAE